MKSQTLTYVAIGVVLVLILGGIAYAGFGTNDDDAMQKDDSAMQDESMQKDADVMKGEDAMNKDDDAMMKDDGAMEDEGAMKEQGSFVNYDASLVAKASPQNRTVLFFNASWCPTCQAAAASLKTAGVPDGVTVLSVDYDSSLELRKKYGVTYQHTFVQVDGSGTQLAKWSGSPTGAAIAAKTI